MPAPDKSASTIFKIGVNSMNWETNFKNIPNAIIKTTAPILLKILPKKRFSISFISSFALVSKSVSLNSSLMLFISEISILFESDLIFSFYKALSKETGFISGSFWGGLQYFSSYLL